jgi:hypothetical protein
MFTHYRSLWELTDEAAGTDKARQNAAAFVAEVTQEIRNQQQAQEHAA